MLKLKLQYFGHLLQRADSLEKDSDAGRDWGQEEKGTTEDEMAGWHHQLDGHESEWTPGDGDGQAGLACCYSWGCKEQHDWATELNWTKVSRRFCFQRCYHLRLKACVAVWDLEQPLGISLLQAWKWDDNTVWCPREVYAHHSSHICSWKMMEREGPLKGQTQRLLRKSDQEAMLKK